jgi:hypothetical protein
MILARKSKAENQRGKSGQLVDYESPAKFNVDGYKLILRLMFRVFSHSSRPDTQAFPFSTSSIA